MEEKKSVRTRLAPSPTGSVHIGTMYMALFDYVFTRQQGGSFILRIEDTDRTRLVEGAIDKVYEALDWLQIAPDESPKEGGSYAPYIQSERLPLYQKYVQQLLDSSHAYHCFCTRERLEQVRETQMKNKEQPKYDRLCLALAKEDIEKKLAAGESYTVRMKVPDNEEVTFYDLARGDITFQTNQIDDQVILKSDGYPTYHMAVVVDDHLMKITHVFRGEEWISSTPKHILLCSYLGWKMPEVAHLQLFRNPDKSKMSKRKGDVSVESYKEKGFLPEALINYMGLLGNPNKENRDIFDIAYLIENFSFKRIPLTGPVFDVKKLEWMNGMYIRNMDTKELAKRIEPYLHINTKAKDEAFFIASLALIQERLKRFDEGDELLDLFYNRPSIDLKEKTDMLKDMMGYIKNDIDDATKLEADIREYATEKGLKAGEVFTILRDSVTGKKATPPLIPVIQVLGKEETLLRIQNSIGE